MARRPPYSRAKGTPWATALIDDVAADLGQTIDIGLAGPEIAALDGVVKEPEDGVAVILIVLGGVDAALGRDGMAPAGTVLQAEGLDIVAKFGQGGGGRGPGQAGADHDDGEFAFIGRIDQFAFKTVLVPFFGQGAGGNFRIEVHEIALCYWQWNVER